MQYPADAPESPQGMKEQAISSHTKPTGDDNMKFSKSLVSALVAGVAAAAFSGGALAQDVDAAKDLMKQNKCTQCHGMDKDKDGPSFKKTAAKYKGKADAEATLVKHLTSSPKVKLADGSEEEHKVVKTTPPNDKAQVANLVKYILSL